MISIKVYYPAINILTKPKENPDPIIVRLNLSQKPA